jgi:Cu-Zn family superoxide dismutase
MEESPMNKSLRAFLAVSAICLLGAVSGAQAQGMKRATSDIQGDGVSGQATLVETANASGMKLEITITLKGDPAKLNPGKHGVHLHDAGACEAPFTSAGGHFDPGPASNTNPDVNHPYHMGDLPNIEINAKGEGKMTAVTTRATLSDGPLSLLDANGAAIIIHKNEDQGITGADKSGVSGGPRMGCGVIKAQ